MGLQHAFGVLSQVVEQVERRGRSVRDVEATTDSDTAGALAVSMTMPVSLCAASNGTLDSSFTLERASLSESGGITVTLSATDLLPELSTAETVSDIDEQGVHVDDGDLLVTVGFRIAPDSSAAAATTTGDGAPDEEQSRDPSGAGTDAAAGENSDTLAARLLAARADDVSADNVALDDEQSRDASGEDAEPRDDSGDDGLTARLAAVRTDDVPAYEDTDYLRLLYESCGTFTDMSDRIEMDVAAETVRRYMIEADIHSPKSYDTTAHDDCDDDTSSVAGDSEAAFEGAGSGPSPTATEDIPEEQFVTDGIGLPDGVTVEDIVDAVVDATAVYEVQRSLGLGHGQTRDLLRQLNVLDLVLHRIDDRPHGVSKDDVVQRIRQCDAGAACPSPT
ncbi:hypothetical protein NDI56_17300 [Haloarcula sp. S1CR25-12]|uniref:FtsK gamma domain-containing protein n=1 Tax=Haloarcula saliterrae TaxID=2950534 RepID=A0ABU2FG00_9EURY|nr:hypothetical protein [Haloarcula sp. S1CR25-12]MDS0261159.1 hypothetical protein [Haloarcula sp. S1CR25-12]